MSKNSRMQIGEKIRSYRKLRGLTQKELAQKINKTESSVRKYEKGLIDIPLNVLESIAKALDTKTFAIIGEVYLDLMYPDIAKNSAMLEAFVNYLISQDYEVNETYKTDMIPIENIPQDKLEYFESEFEELNGVKVLEVEHLIIEIIKNGKVTYFEEDDFMELQKSIADVIEYRIWQHNKKTEI